jgi:hypothetical protein
VMVGTSVRLYGDRAGAVLSAAVAVVAGTLLFWLTMHFLLAGRETWRRLFRSALTTAVFWVGLGVFSHFYFSSSMISDNKLYGPIGAVFDLVTWVHRRRRCPHARRRGRRRVGREAKPTATNWLTLPEIRQKRSHCSSRRPVQPDLGADTPDSTCGAVQAGPPHTRLPLQ